MTRFVKDRSPALTTLTADRSWTLATVAGVVVAVVAGLAGNRATASETADGARFAAAYPGVIGVAATDAKNVVTEDSIHGEHVSLAAPGYSVVTAFRDWGDCVYGTQGQSSSFATGYVSAAAALLRQRFPQESAAQITHRLEVTASRAKRDARDDKAGWGLIQPYEPMTLAYDISVGGVHRPGLHRRARRVLLAAHRLARVGAGPRHDAPLEGWGAGLLPPLRGRAEIAMLAAYGALAGLAYGLLLNLSF